jgi:hypothetical protein
MDECNNAALETAVYNIGIFRPASAVDDLNEIEVPDCENDAPPYGGSRGRGYGRGYGYGYGSTPYPSDNPWGDLAGYGWGGGDTIYVCVGAPAINSSD